MMCGLHAPHNYHFLRAEVDLELLTGTNSSQWTKGLAPQTRNTPQGKNMVLDLFPGQGTTRWIKCSIILSASL